MAKKKEEYGNESIKSLKGADRVRKRPAVIFGSDGVEGCAHSIFEIVSNSIDEARDGHGNKINVTLYPDHSVEVEDFGRGIPVDYNKAEERWNWDLVFCELYAGGKYGEGSGNYDFSLGLNGLGLCATQYSSEWMTADIYRDGMHYHLDFKKGENVGGLKKEPFTGRRTGSVIRWKPDTDVFTDINVPADTFKDMLRRQAVVNDGVTLVFNDRTGERAEKIEYFYEHGIQDYANEIAGEGTLTPVHFCSGSAIGRDRDDQPEYQVKMNVAFCFSNAVQTLEYYHNSSWLEHGGSPDRAVRLAFVNQINNWLKNKGLYKKNESSITFNDVQDCLILVSSSFSTRTSYENQTKKAITNKFVAQAMTEFLKHQLEVYFVEHPDEAEKACKQVLINKQSREHAEKARVSIKKTMTQQMDLANRVQKFVDCRAGDHDRALPAQAVGELLRRLDAVGRGPARADHGDGDLLVDRRKAPLHVEQARRLKDVAQAHGIVRVLHCKKAKPQPRARAEDAVGALQRLFRQQRELPRLNALDEAVFVLVGIVDVLRRAEIVEQQELRAICQSPDLREPYPVFQPCHKEHLPVRFSDTSPTARPSQRQPR